MMVQEHISLRQLLLREEDVLSWYSMPITQTSFLKRTNPDASRTEANEGRLTKGELKYGKDE
jgi:hypothetical protein